MLLCRLFHLIPFAIDVNLKWAPHSNNRNLAHIFIMLRWLQKTSTWSLHQFIGLRGRGQFSFKHHHQTKKKKKKWEATETISFWWSHWHFQYIIYQKFMISNRNLNNSLFVDIFVFYFLYVRYYIRCALHIPND